MRSKSVTVLTAVAALVFLPRCGAPLEGEEEDTWGTSEEALLGSYPVESTLITNHAVFMRHGPAPTFGIIKAIPFNQKVTLLRSAPNNQWYNVRHGGDTGWVYRDFVKMHSGPDYQNFVLDKAGNPFCAKFNGLFHLYLPDMKFVNGALAGGRVLAFTSKDLVHWTPRGEVFNNLDQRYDGHQTIGLWAPEVFAHNGKYYLYYVNNLSNPLNATLGDKDVMVAESNDPLDFSKPTAHRRLLDGDHPFIDPSPFKDPRTGKLYLTYKARVPGRTELRIRPMSDPMTFSGGPTTLLSSVDVPNAFGVLEHPDMIRIGDVYFLMFSKGLGDQTSYQIAYATARHPTGPFTQRGSLFKSSAELTGNLSNKIIAPGASSIVWDSAGQSWMVYRQKKTTETQWTDRTVMIDKVTFDPANKKIHGTATRGVRKRGPAALPSF